MHGRGEAGATKLWRRPVKGGWCSARSSQGWLHRLAEGFWGGVEGKQAALLRA